MRLLTGLERRARSALATSRIARVNSRRDLTRAIRLVAKADLALRSNPVSKRLVLERLVIDLTSEPKVEVPAWMQEQLPV